ncbi:serine/threonine protein kinase [Saccharopolyspora erythraea]|uniref:serine/threonine protein kinase n=1 Tax=Saccharopolyspora erythraea TaxID=1836 RepID=UPI001BA70A14|nr:serine/threonine-protein kinase [Saccharopolyspora erythraea]QUG99876.1 serine/threonine protein kinase [Saccharopolyspora erythraea]
MSEDLTGRRLGHYKIDAVLGRGGMSVMYRATDTRLGRKVALKVMGEHITGDAEFRERFVDEARNTSAIDHANIVPLYDFGEVDGMLYIAMRLVDGSDLASKIKDGPISAQRTLELLGQVAEALDMLHERNLVHLDLKPANVLVTSRESSSEHVYLADFGLTRRGATGHRTSSGDFLGSPTYAAPEHLRGEPVDGRTDLYALACMLFACLTGRPPFQGQVQEVIQGHLNGEPPKVTSLVVLPAEIDDVLRRGMAKKADQRYSTCKGLITAAKAALSPVAGEGAARRRAEAAPPGPPSGAVPVQQHPQQAYPPPPPVQQQPYPGPQQYQQQMPQTLPPPASDPVRLRPPMPVGSSSFATKSGSSAKWIVPVLVVVALVVLVVLFVLMAGSLGSGGGSTEPTSSRTSTYNSNNLPSEVPTVGD